MASRVLDFDNFLMEKKEEPIEIRVYGKTYHVKPAVPAIVPVMMARANESPDENDTVSSVLVLKAGDAMFGKKVIDEFCEHGMTTEELGTLIRQTFDLINGKGIDDDTETLSDEDGMKVETKAKK